MMRTLYAFPLLYLLASMILTASVPARSEDWPLLGRNGTRNAVSPEKNPPTYWQPEVRTGAGEVTQTAQNIKWTAPLGDITFGTPVVSHGLVWVGTSEAYSSLQNRGYSYLTLKCFRERDGKLLYEYKATPLSGRIHVNGLMGIGSSPLIEGDRLWFTTNRFEVVCLDISPLLREGRPPREVWKLDMIRQLGVYPSALIMGPPRTCSPAPSYRDRIFIVTGNGINPYTLNLPASEAPSLVCLDKNTGKVLWKDNSPGQNILATQMGSPLVATIKGRAQVIVPQGDGWLRSFDPIKGTLLWKFDLNPKEAKYTKYGRGGRNEIMATPVLYENRIYIASGKGFEEGEGPGRLCCIDPTKRGDISSELAVDGQGNPLPHRREQAVDVNKGERAIPNPNSGLVWEFREGMQRTMSTVAIQDGLVIAPDFYGSIHCLDARTGKKHWSCDTQSRVYSSPLIVGGYVYLSTMDGDVMLFRLSAEPGVAMKAGKPYETIDMRHSNLASPIFANGVLFVPAGDTLYAVRGNTRKPGRWPQWRGAKRDNVSLETGLLREWPEAGPPLRWQAEEIGEGIGSVSVEGGRIYTMGVHDNSEFALALDQETGQKVWSARVGPVVIAESALMRWLSQRTPTLDGERIYVFTSAGDLVCLRTADGKELWRKSYPQDFGSELPVWGYCDHPLIDGDRLICAPSGKEATLAALDKRSGKVLWKTSVPEEDRRQGYAAISLAETGGIRQYVAFTATGILGVAAADGKLLWQYTGLTNRVANTHSPMVRGDLILCSNGYNTGFTLLKLVRQGDGMTVQEQYRTQIALDPFQDATVWVGEHAFALQGNRLLCLEVKTGKLVWGPIATPQRGKTALVWADNRLYLRHSSGAVTLAEVNAAGYLAKGSLILPDVVPAVGATAPVIADGRLFLRDNNRLFCYDIREGALKQLTKPARRITFTLNAHERAGMPTPTPVGKNKVPDAVFVPTPQEVVEKMLELAAVRKSEVVTDLGSGDGRIVITAARKYGSKAVGYELDIRLVALSREKVSAEKLNHLVQIELQDIFTVDLRPVDVVAVFLYPHLLERLLPQFEKLKPGSRIVSHQFAIPGIKLDRTVKVKTEEDGEEHTVYLYITPLKKE